MSGTNNKNNRNAIAPANTPPPTAASCSTAVKAASTVSDRRRAVIRRSRDSPTLAWTVFHRDVRGASPGARSGDGEAARSVAMPPENRVVRPGGDDHRARGCGIGVQLEQIADGLVDMHRHHVGAGPAPVLHWLVRGLECRDLGLLL